MSNLLSNFIFILLALSNLNEKSFNAAIATHESQLRVIDPNAFVTLCKKYEILNNSIRDGKIDVGAALKEVQSQIPKIKAAYYKAGGKDWKQSLGFFLCSIITLMLLGETMGVVL